MGIAVAIINFALIITEVLVIYFGVVKEKVKPFVALRIILVCATISVISTFVLLAYYLSC